MMAMASVDSRAGNMAVEMAVEIAVKADGEMAVDWFNLMVGEMADCWGEKMVVSRVA